MMILPWHTKQWEIFQASLLNNKMAHAYLLIGVPGLGKSEFAINMARFLLCKTENSCEQCQSCLLFKSQTHPDYKFITPEAESKVIKISQIRELNEFVVQTSQIAKYKVICILPAEAMNKAAANALLKTLEEPARNTIIILVSGQASKLPATVRSRCQLIKFNLPPENLSLSWLSQKLPTDQTPVLLKLAYGAPLKALEIYQSVEFASRAKWFNDWQEWQSGKLSFSNFVSGWQQQPLEVLLNNLLSWLIDLLQLQITCNKQFVINIDFIDSLSQLSRELDTKALVKYIGYLQEKNNLLQGQISINPQLLLEEVLIKWLAVIRTRERADVS